MIRYRFQPIWISSANATQKEVPFREGIRVRDVLAKPDRLGLWVAVNGEHETDLDRKLSDNDSVLEAIKPKGVLESKLAIFLVEKALYAFAAFVLGKIIVSLFPAKKRKDDTGSGTYSWSGLRNDRLEGQPKQVVYGQIRMAPQVLDEYIQTDLNRGENDLYTLLSFGEGPIEAIGNITTDTAAGSPMSTDDPANPVPDGIQIQGNSIDNFSGVQAWVRTGTSEQEPVPGFQQINTEFAVGITLNQLETASASNAALNPNLDINAGTSYFNPGAAAQAVWTQYAAGIDLTTEADAFSAVIDFPQGLFRVKDSGAIDLAYFTPLVRYIELDSFGNPITTGGNNPSGIYDAGYVYLPPTDTLAVKQQDSFNYQINGVFFDPQNFTPGGLGRCATIQNSTTFGVNYVRTISNVAYPAGFPSAGNFAEEFTVSFWLYLTEASDTLSGNPPSIEHRDSTIANRGWKLEFRRLTTGTLRFVIKGNGWEANPLYAYPNPGWTHVAFIYRKNGTNGLVDRILYVNGVYIGNLQGSQAAAPITVPNGRLNIGGYSSCFGFSVDELAYRPFAQSSSDIATEYNNGYGRYLTGSSAEFIGLYHFDSGAGLTDSSGNANALQLLAPATAGSDNGKVYSTGLGPLKRAKYRVEVLRLNVKSTSQFVQDESIFSVLNAKRSAELAYPYTPLLGLKVKATDQLNSSAPTVTALVRGVKVPVYNGTSIAYEYSNNPAWVALDIISNPRYGRGIDFPFSRINLQDFLNWADYCDEFIPDGRSYQEQNIDESPTVYPGPAQSEIVSMRYSSTLIGGTTPGIQLFYRYSSGVYITQPPSYWKSGRYVAFENIPVPGGGVSGINLNINRANVGGMEIYQTIKTATGWEVWIYWDKDTYGVDPWADGGYLDTVLSGASLTGKAIGVEKRFEYNGVFDDFSNAWDAMVSVCQTARAMPMLEGGTVRIRYERPRLPVTIIGMGNIIADSFKLSFTDKLNLPNSYSCDFLDEDQNYSRSVASLDDSTLDSLTETFDIQRDSLDLPGVTRRSQVMRHLQYLLNVNRLATQAVEFQLGLDGLALEVGDIAILSHDIVPFGTGGRISGAGTSTVTSVFLDRDIDTSSGTWYLRIRSNSAGQVIFGTQVTDAYETCTVTSAGIITIGSPVLVSGGFTFIPQRGDVYILYKDGEEFKAQIVEISLSENMTRTVRAIKYEDSIYDVDSTGYPLPSSLAIEQQDPPVSQSSIPQDVSYLAARQSLARNPSGGYSQKVDITWVNGAETIRAQAGSRILYRKGTDASWEIAGTVDGPKESFSFTVPEGAPGEYLEICVQPYSYANTRRRAEICTKLGITLIGAFVPPSKPQSFVATMQGQQAVYSITPPQASRSLSYEIRRGGWILGQAVDTIPDGRSEIESPNWLGAGSNALGESAPILLVRSKDDRQHYSEALALTGFNPAPDGAQVLAPPVSEYTNYPDQAWEDFAASPGQWVNGGLGQPSLSGLQVTTYNGRKVLEFSGANLSGTYTTAGKLSLLTAQPEWAWVQFHSVADQVSPWTVSQLASLPVGSPIGQNLTVEGLLTYLSGPTPEFDYLIDTAPCTIKTQMRFTTSASGSFGDWVDYKPGLYNFVNVQFRITVTRPNTDYNIRIYRCHSRLSRLPVGVWERNLVQDYIYRKMLRNG